MATEPRADSAPPTTGKPEAFPTPTPPGLQAVDHSRVLQTIMELQKSTGGLAKAVGSLEKSVDTQTGEIRALTQNVTKVVTVGWVARWAIGTGIALLGAIGTLIGILLWRLPSIIAAMN